MLYAKYRGLTINIPIAIINPIRTRGYFANITIQSRGPLRTQPPPPLPVILRQENHSRFFAHNLHSRPSLLCFHNQVPGSRGDPAVPVQPSRTGCNSHLQSNNPVINQSQGLSTKKEINQSEVLRWNELITCEEPITCIGKVKDLTFLTAAARTKIWHY